MMDVGVFTWIVAIVGLLMIVLLGSLQLVAVLRPRADWTIENVYGGSPEVTDPTAYFAFNQGFAWSDVFLFVPLQVAGSTGMMLGERWGFLLALAASVLLVYSAFSFFFWDRDLGFREPTFNYWFVVWGVWPLFGLVEAVYTFARLLGA